MIAIIDYGVGNLFSLKSSLAAIGAETIVEYTPGPAGQTQESVLSPHAAHTPYHSQKEAAFPDRCPAGRNMLIFPAIDLKDGKVVRLYKGNFDTVHQVAEDPLSTAAAFRAAGAKYLHMVDLDGARDGVRKNAATERVPSVSIFVKIIYFTPIDSNCFAKKR